MGGQHPIPVFGALARSLGGRFQPRHEGFVRFQKSRQPRGYHAVPFLHVTGFGNVAGEAAGLRPVAPAVGIETVRHVAGYELENLVPCLCLDENIGDSVGRRAGKTGHGALGELRGSCQNEFVRSSGVSALLLPPASALRSDHKAVALESEDDMERLLFSIHKTFQETAEIPCFEDIAIPGPDRLDPFASAVPEPNSEVLRQREKLEVRRNRKPHFPIFSVQHRIHR